MRKNKLGIVILAVIAVVCIVLAGCQHKHSFSNTWSRDETNHWRECSGCDQVSAKDTHTFGDWIVDIEPTLTTTGSQHRTCRVCLYDETGIIPVLGEKHDHVFGGEWKSDGVSHWRVCQCGEISEKADHTPSDWIVDTPATAFDKGSQHKECTVCGRVLQIEDIDPLGEDHQHSFDGGYNSDSAYHWKTCICGAISANAEHTPSNWIVDTPATTLDKGSQHKECTVCGKVLQIEDIDRLEEEHKHSFEGGYNSDSAHHWKTCICGVISEKIEHTPSNWIIDLQATLNNSGSRHKECTVCGKVLQTETIPQLTQGEQSTGTVNFYAINDFHGEYERLAQISGYISARGNEVNTVTLNSGDMFQGSMESNSNYGKLFAECMDIAGFDAFTFGNHEFDWGLDKLKALANNSNVPYLGANIYNWNANNRTWGDFAEDLAQEYAIKDLDNGLRVGIIGVIGKDQITSISSQLVQTIGFKDPKDIVPNLSKKLRQELGCDIVVVSAHTGQNTFLDDYSWDITQYVDAVFCAHSHQNELTTKNGVPFIQGGSYGNNVSHVRLTVDSDGNVTCNANENIYFYDLNGIDQGVYSRVQSKIDNSNAQIAAEANEILAYSSDYLDYQTGVPRLVAHAIAEYAIEQGHDIELAMVNKGRSGLYSGRITYTELYNAIPFDNVVYIAKVSGADIISEAGYSDQSIWRVSDTVIENSSRKYYMIAVIDYLLYHQNSNRNYNYFPSAFTSGFDPIPLTKQGVDQYNYRFITRDFLRKQGNVDASIYLSNNVHTDKSLLTQSVDINGGNSQQQVVHEGTLYDPYSVADAIIVASGRTNQNAVWAYVKGYATDLANVKAGKTGDIGEFYLQENNGWGAKIYVYYLSKYENSSLNHNWSSIYEIEQGDELLIYVKLFTYSGTPEIGGGYCVARNGNYI